MAGVIGSIRITCIVRSGGARHEHITHVGSAYGLESVGQVVLKINLGVSYHVDDSVTGKSVAVEVVNNIAELRPYIRTLSNGRWTDNLLSLPTCAK